MFLLTSHVAIDSWLAEHPTALGALAIVLGFALLAFGSAASLSGRATPTYEVRATGGRARATGFVWIGCGVLCLYFGLFKLATGWL